MTEPREHEHAHVYAISDADTAFAACPISARIFEHRGKVTRIKDGDTCVALLDEGDGVGRAVPIRYEKVKCPEMSKPGGEAARDFNAQMAAGQWITFQTRRRRDQWGRMLGDVYVYRGAHTPPLDLSQAIIDGGFGEKY